MVRVLELVIWMGGLTWLALLGASLALTRGWTLTGMRLAFGNRDDLPPASPLAGRAERAARNTLENFVLFAVLALVALAAGAGASPRVLAGAELFFWSRLVYLAVYWAGIRYLRTAVWAVGVGGLGAMLTGLP